MQTHTHISPQALSEHAAENIRAQFPLLAAKGAPIFLDSGASAQTLQCVVNAVTEFYTRGYANIHRGNYPLSLNATASFEAARETAAAFLNAPSAGSGGNEIIFTSGTTAAFNLLASSWGGAHLVPGSVVLISAAEHHANLVPWQVVCQRTGAELKIIPLNENGTLNQTEYAQLLAAGNVACVSLMHVSNVLGTINPVKEMTAAAKAKGAAVFIDGAQAVPHFGVNVQEIGADAYVFSGHKLFGPTGIGVLWGGENFLNTLTPFQYGGDMVASVAYGSATYKPAPARFEAGTPNIAGALGLAAAMQWLMQANRSALEAHENHLTEYLLQQLQAVPGLKIYGPQTPNQRVCLASFNIKGLHALDVAEILAAEDICVRVGHHCAEPLQNSLGLQTGGGSIRASLAFYNTTANINALIKGLHKAVKLLN